MPARIKGVAAGGIANLKMPGVVTCKITVPPESFSVAGGYVKRRESSAA